MNNTIKYTSPGVSKQSSLQTSYAERLGWNKDDKVVLFHIDDAGMSCESNEGAIQALRAGIATSVSVMMPCAWASQMTNYLKANPLIDAGIHLTHTSEWYYYKWMPLCGIKEGESLTDATGAFHKNVAALLQHAQLSTIAAELYAQLEQANRMGIQSTHLDTHMGVLWASSELLNIYVQAGIKNNIPVLLPAGHNTLVMQQAAAGGPLSPFKELHTPQQLVLYGEQLWTAGLPVIDDLHVSSYDWVSPQQVFESDDALCSFKTKKYMELLDAVKPGITVILMHCTDASNHFSYISNSGNTRKGDMLAMTNPALKEFIGNKKIKLTNWRELKQRREIVTQQNIH